MKNTIENLTEINFEHIGDWALNNNCLDYIITKKNTFIINNCLYAMVVINENKTTIKYIGKTTQSLERRFYGYKRGNGASTNNRIHKNIVKELLKNNKVEIWALADDTPLKWGEYNINLAAGLEDSFIEKIKPEWNGGQTETSEAESTLYQDLKTDSDTNKFSIKIGKTYYNLGSINPGVKASTLLGKHGEEITIQIGNENPIIVNSFIDRKANQNGSVRINPMPELVKYYQNEYKLDDFAVLEVIDKHNIKVF
jgi:hypothetical protein